MHYHIHHIKYTELKEIYFYSTLRAIGIGLMGIFIPIYLYNLGIGLISICYYFIVAYIFRILFVFLAAYLVDNIGPKHLIALSLVLDSFFMIGLSLTKITPQYYILSGILYGAARAMFWTAHNVNMSLARDHSKTSSEVSNFYVFQKIGTAFAPLIGGIIATTLDVQYTLWLAAAVFLTAIYPLFKTEEAYRKEGFSLEKMKQIPFRDSLSCLGYSYSNESLILVWPFFAFLFLNTYAKIGGITTLALVCSIAVAYYWGKSGDNGKKEKQLRYGSVSSTVVHVLRTLVSSLSGIALVNIFSDITRMMISVPFVALYYERSDLFKRLEYVVAMEIASSFGMMFVWLTILAGAYFFSLEVNLIVSFVVAGLFALMSQLIIDKNYA